MILIGSVICPQDYSDMFCDKDSRVIQLHLPIDRSQVILAEVIATTIALTQSGRPFPGLLHPFAHAYFQFSFLFTLFNNLANGNLIPFDVHGKTLFSIRLSFVHSFYGDSRRAVLSVFPVGRNFYNKTTSNNLVFRQTAGYRMLLNFRANPHFLLLLRSNEINQI